MNDEVLEAVGDVLSAMPAGDTSAWSEEHARGAFERLVGDGWSRVGLAERLGGSGGDIVDAGSIAWACAASDHRLPMGDIVLITARLLELVQMSLPDDVTCAVVLPELATLSPTGGIDLRAQRVPWGRWASHFLVLVEGGEGTAVHLVPASESTVASGQNLCGEPRDEVTLTNAASINSTNSARPAGDLRAQIRLAGALVRSIAMSAATTAVLDLCTVYCVDRKQFGKRLIDFQAVQQEIAGLHGESAASAAAVDHALEVLAALTTDQSEWPVAPVAVAKTRTGLAASRAARAAHQLHGAIGTTLEYPLHRHTKALWSWRDEFGVESAWATVLLEQVDRMGQHVDPWHGLTMASVSR